LHLAGHSFGGWVAFEMARRLEAAGRTVASLTLIDSAPPAATAAIREASDAETLTGLIRIYAQMAQRPLGIGADDLAALPEPRQRELLHQRLVAAGVLPLRTTPDILLGPMRTFAGCVRTSYAPAAPYGGRVDMAVLDDPDRDPSSNAQRAAARSEAWRAWAPRLRSWRGPGNHMTALRQPHVQTVADWMRDNWRSAGVTLRAG
jgi:arthrofactin-type cyclic lipopeptide synthetase C